MKNRIEPGIFIEITIETTSHMAASRFHKSPPKVLSSLTPYFKVEAFDEIERIASALN